MMFLSSIRRMSREAFQRSERVATSGILIRTKNQTTKFYTTQVGRDANTAGRSVNTGTIVKITGGGTALALALSAIGYLYCEKVPNGEFCSHVREHLDLKKK